MKKYSILFLSLAIAFILSGCSISFTKTKPNKNYYTTDFSASVLNQKDIKSVMYETSLYKQRKLSQEDYYAINKFFTYVKTSYFINKPKDIPKYPKYKLFFTTNKKEYVMEIYNEKYISVFPWDGYYPKDYIDISKVPVYYNLFNLCKYDFMNYSG